MVANVSHFGVEPEAALPDSPASGADPLIASLDALVEDAAVDRSQFYSSAAAATLEAAFRSRYRVLGTLGQGSMGQVLDAEDVRLHRRVAIKVISARDATTAAFTRRESEVLAALRHPGIVTVYDCGELADGRPYFVMEQVPGENLLDYCRTHQLGLRDKLELMRLISRSVGMAHLLTIVHRDLKPQNIRVRPDGKPTILDFGIAKFETLDLPADASEPANRPHEGGREPTARTPYETVVRGGIKGTLRYMSPEQAAGELVDSRADVYALGLILYELLTGTLPHDEPASDITPARWAARLRAQPPRNLRQLAPQVPVDVAALVERCLAQRAADRYATAGQLADDLDAYLAGEPVAAVSRHRSLYRLQKFTRRHWISTTLGLTAAAIIVAVITLAFTRVREERNLAREHAARAEASLRVAAVERRRAEDHLAVAQREERRARERELATERHLYTEHMGQAKRLINSGNLFQAIALLDQYAELDKDAAADGTPRGDATLAQTDHRGFEWHFLKKLCQREHRQLTGHAAAINCLRYSRDGNCLASGDDAGAVRIWRLNSNGEPITLDAHRHAVVDVTFSSNGQVLATIGADRKCRVWEISSGRALAELHSNNNPLVSVQLTSVALSSDGSQCATGDTQGDVTLWQVATGEARRVDDAQSRPGPCYLAFSSDDATLLVGGKGQNARAFDVASGQRVAQSPTLAGPVTRVCAADTPAVFAAGDLFGCVYLFKRDGDKLACQAPLTILSGRVRDLSFSLDGQAVVAVAESGAAVAIGINDGRTRSKLEAVERSARAIAAHVGAERPNIAWSTPDHAIDVYVFPKPREYDRIATADSPNWLDLSPDDRTLAVAFGNKSYVELIDTSFAKQEHEPTPQQSLEQAPEPTGPPPSKQSTRRFSDHRGPLASVSFSRDGSLLLAADGLGFVAVRDLSTDDADTKPRTHEFGWANSVAAVFAGPESAVYAGGLEGKLRVWLPGSSKVATLQGGHGPLPVLCVAATRDGRRVASGCFDGTLAIWDTSDNKLLKKVSAHRHQINQIAIDPAGEVVATTSLDSTVRLWSMADGRELATLPCERPSWGVAFSADGRTLATSHDLGEPDTSYLQLWNVTTRRELFRLPAPAVSRWTALRFSSDGLRLYATGGNGDTAGIYCWCTVASPATSLGTQHADAEHDSGQATP